MLEGKNILIATGSQPAKPPIEGLDSPGVVTSDELLTRLEELPESIIIMVLNSPRFLNGWAARSVFWKDKADCCR